MIHIQEYFISGLEGLQVFGLFPQLCQEDPVDAALQPDAQDQQHQVGGQLPGEDQDLS